MNHIAGLTDCKQPLGWRLCLGKHLGEIRYIYIRRAYQLYNLPFRIRLRPVNQINKVSPDYHSIRVVRIF